MDRLLLLVAGGLVIFLGGVFCFFLYWIRVSKTLHRMENMLEAAVSGNFSEEVFSESRLSALEARMGQYLKGQAGREQKLKDEQKAVHALISDISHQTKTPVANLLLYSQLLEEEKLSGQAGKLAAQILFQSEKLRFLTDSLFKASSLERGAVVLSPKRSPVRDLLEQTAMQAKPKAALRGIRIQWKIERPEDKAFFDQRWTGEALWNILDNAVKYTCQGDTILLEGVSYEFFYRITVTDHGPGIREEEIPKIFQRFYRSRQVREVEGVGIGLYLAREIIGAQGGYIKGASGKETVFSLFLPRNGGGEILQNC